jgi:hypothetical protein
LFQNMSMDGALGSFSFDFRMKSLNASTAGSSRINNCSSPRFRGSIHPQAQTNDDRCLGNNSGMSISAGGGLKSTGVQGGYSFRLRT